MKRNDPGPYPVSSRPRICVISFPRLAALLESVAVEFASQAEVVIENRRFGDAVVHARGLVERGAVDVFISAGANGAQLRRQLDYPVVLVKVSGFDIMRALVQAARLAQHVGVVTYEQVSDELKDMSRLLNIRLELRRYIDERDVRERVEELRALGVEAVIGPSLVTEMAAQCGIHGVFIYSPESARQALEDAIAAARVAAIEQSRRQQLAAILGTLREGVVAIDCNERIWLANRAMGELLQHSPAELEGQPLARFLPDAGVADVLAGRDSGVRKVFLIGGRRMLGHIVPIEEAGVRSAAVLTLQDASSVERAGRDLRLHARNAAPRARHVLGDIKGEASAIRQLRELAQRFAAMDLTVLIRGESGTGKELVAQGIHAASARAAEPFVAINCAAMPESLLESELFGYEEGAFTGASKGGKPGLLEAAHRGTVFLDEVGDMPASLQVRLLRVLQEREVLRVGGREPIPIDVRVIAATHRDLPQRVAAGEFRQDLFYRLNGLVVLIPPLRERATDLPLLMADIIARRQERFPEATLSDEVRDRFLFAAQGYSWPGNVRELENMVERLIAAAAVDASGMSLPLEVLLPEFAQATGGDERHAPGLVARRQAMEQSTLEAAVSAAGGNMTAAARHLGISRTTLWRKLNQRTRS